MQLFVLSSAKTPYFYVIFNQKLVFNYAPSKLVEESLAMIRVFLLFLFLFSKIGFSQNLPTNPVLFQVHRTLAYELTFSFENVANNTNYLVLMSTYKSDILTPLQGKVYQRGDQLGSAKVVQFSSDTIVNPRAIRANTKYFFYVYTSQVFKGKIEYQLKKPLVIEVLTANLNPGNYYESISVSAPNFLIALSELIYPHKVLTYSAYKNTLLAKLELRDTVGGRSYIECAYSGERNVFDEPFDWMKEGYSREHTFPHSWMPSHPADNPPLSEYSDFHNLYPTNLEKVNTIRNNFPLGEVTGKVLYIYLEGRLGYSGNQIVYEPRDTHKGNAARAMMYMSIAYSNQNNNWNFPSIQSQEIIKKWHFHDPPDNYEIARQEYIYALQGNRNPFIDHPEYACFIDFSKLVKMKEMCNSSIIEKENTDLSIQFQNHMLKISSEEVITEIIIYDATGKELMHDFPNAIHFQNDNLFRESTFCFLVIRRNGVEVVRRKMVIE